MIQRIAYLAPELPSLSATFVTNEIWALEAQDMEILPYSIHTPGHPAHGDRAAHLAQRTTIVYATPVTRGLMALGQLALKHTRSALKATGYLVTDMIKTGLLTPKALKLAYQFLHGAHLAQDLRRRNAQHLHIHFAHVPTQVGMYAATLAEIPFTFMSHANDLFERPLLIPEKVRRAKQAVTISQFNIELMTRMGADRQQMDIVRCGVHAGNTRQPMTGGEHPFVIGTLGRLVEKKGIDVLVSAMAQLKQDANTVRLEIAGDGPLMEGLKTQVESLGLTDQVRFLGALPHAQVMTWMKTLDAFVLAAKKDSQGDMDGIPVVLMEAMTLGIPVLSTRLSGIPELVKHEETGLLSKPGSAQELAANITRLVADPALCASLRDAAAKHIQLEFDRTLNAQRLLHIIHA